MNLDEIKEALVPQKTPEDQVEMIPTGCDLLDCVVGGAPGVYGHPVGVIVNYIGDNSAGKSFVKNEIMACAKHTHGKNLDFFSDDTETGDTFDTSDLYGFDIMPEDRKIGGKPVENSETVEELDAKVTLFLNSLRGKLGIYAVDSLDGLTDEKKKDRAKKRAKQLSDGKEVKNEGTYDLEDRKFLSQSFFKDKHSALAKKRALLIIVSQTREKLDAVGFQQKWRVSGDGAMKFYCHTRVLLKKVKAIKVGDREVGAVVEAKTIKSKTPRPYRKCRFSLYFDYGIDNIGTNLDYLFDLRSSENGDLLKGPCSSISWSGKETKNMNNISKWLKAEGMDKEAREAKKADPDEGSPNLSLDWTLRWLEGDEERAKKFHAHFGISMSRDELIEKIENDPKMQRELTQRVRERWEAEEAEVATNRKRKYS